jgi:CPA2 family monovalent cation:H+ antiporter-2
LESEAFAYRDLIVFLVAAGLVVPVAQRFRITPVMGFLLVGMAIGPHGLGQLASEHPWLRFATIANEEGVRTIGEFGVVLLLFVIGLELSLARLWSMRRMVFGLGGAQMAITATAIGLIAAAFGNTTQAAVVIGACLALSSTAVVMQLLTETHRIGSPPGRALFAVLLFQDLAVVPILSLVQVLGGDAGGSLTLALAKAALMALVAVAGIMAIGNLVVRPLFRLVGATRSRELFMATVLLTVLATGIATEAAGLSMALGAFLAGLLLADTEYRHQVEVDVEPFKGLLIGVFFVAVGMSVDPFAILANPVWIVGSVIGLFAVKGVILYGLGRGFGLSRAVSTELAFTAGQAGEFAFVVIALASGFAILDPAVTQFMTIVVGLSLVLTPMVSRLARSLAARMERDDAAAAEEPPALPADLDQHVVIAGYGRVGRLLGDLLAHENIPFVAVDIMPEPAAHGDRGSSAVFVGDASRREILERVGIDRASAVVVTMDSAVAAERVVGAVRAERPTLPIYARARDAGHARRLLAGGATHVVPETVEASLQLGEAVLGCMGLPEDAARATVEQRRLDEEARYAPRRSAAGEPSSGV